MSTNEPDPLLRVTGAISDREHVDWVREVSDSEDLAELEPELRALENLASFRAAEEDVAAPPETWGTLLLRERLGEGGFGAVYRAYDPALEREVALKLLKPERLGDAETARFLSEARRLARVRHPHVVVVHGADSRDGQVGVWMELIDGMTVEDVLVLLGRFSPYEATMVCMQVCRALAAVHAAGIVHLDVKTTNVMREQGGRIVLMDFGAGRELLSAERGATHGTPLVIAPEQLRGEPAGPAADLYAVGVMMYRLVSGRFPLEAGTLAEIADRLEKGNSTPLRDLRPDLPPEFLRVIERALKPLPEQRYASAGAMEGALAMAAGTFTRTELGVPVTTDARRSRDLSRRLALGAVMLLIGAAIGFLLANLIR